MLFGAFPRAKHHAFWCSSACQKSWSRACSLLQLFRLDSNYTCTCPSATIILSVDTALTQVSILHGPCGPKMCDLRKVLVAGMIDAFYGLIASLDFPWLVCLFLGFSFPLFLPWKPNKTRGNQRKPKENHRIHTAPNQRKSQKIKGNQRKSKETEGNQRKSK